MTLYEIAAQLREIQADLEMGYRHYLADNGRIDYMLTAALRLGVGIEAVNKLITLKAEVMKLASESKEPKPSPGEES
jgi:hypothetical protein